MPTPQSQSDFEALMRPKDREAYRRRQAASFLRRTEVPSGSNADEWHLYLAENTDALPMVAVKIAEAIEAAAAEIWTEFVARCEALETQAEQAIEEPAASVSPEGIERWRTYYRGQRIAAKAIRRAVDHPKYRRR